LLRLLADELDCPHGALRLLRGQTSRHKVILVQGMTAEEVERKIQAAIHVKKHS